MEKSVQQVRIICFAMAASILMYAGLAWRLPSTATLKPIVFQVITFLAVSLVISIFVARRAIVTRTESALATRPDDTKLLARWRAGQILTYMLCEAIAVYGMVLHFLGGSLTQVAPFFIAGFVLMLFYAPRATRQEYPPDSRP